jgi:hypothetical protein
VVALEAGLELDGGCKVLFTTSLSVNSIDLVVFSLCQCNPFRLVLILVVDVGRVDIVPKGTVPVPDGNLLWVEGRSHAEGRGRVHTEHAGVVAGEIEAVLARRGGFEVPVPDLTNFIRVVSGLLEDKLERLCGHWPRWGVRHQVGEADALSTIGGVILASGNTWLAGLVDVVIRGGWASSSYARDFLH